MCATKQCQRELFSAKMNDPNLLEDLAQLAPCSECRYYLPDELNTLSLNNDTFSLLHLNVRSLPKNFDNLSNLLNSINHTFSFIGITESWLKSNSPPLFNIQGYSMLKSERPNGRGGGVVL